RELVLDITPQTRLEHTANGLIIPSIPGSVIINATHSGEPIAMRITLPVALPAASGSSVEIIALSYDEPLAGRLAPVPFMKGGRESIAVPEYRVDARAYASWHESGPAAELRYLGIARDVHSGTIAIRPYEYDAVGDQ